LGDGAVVIGTVAVLRVEKGLLTLVEAFARVQRDYPRTKLLIVGSGPLRQQLEDTARALGIGASVHFEPATSNVADWLNTMDIFVLPSLSEALSNSLMEAMACGVAPVASTVGGNPELVREGETGLLFAPEDAAALAAQLRRLVFDQALRRRFGAAAASFIAENMTIEKSSARMASIYEGFLEGRNGPLPYTEQ
jgi:glycosyltransferase involved in cell wall biosynthesis